MPSASLTLRNVKGSALTFTEMDDNLTSLAAAANASATASSLTTLDANVGSYQAYANSTFGTDSFNSGVLYDVDVGFGDYVPIRYSSGGILANVGRAHYWTDNTYAGALFGTLTSTDNPNYITSGQMMLIQGVGADWSPAGNQYNDNLRIIVPSVRDLPLTGNATNFNTSFSDTWGNVHIHARGDSRYEFSNIGLRLPADSSVTNAVLKETRETVVANGSTSGDISIDGGTGPIQTYTLTGDVTLWANNVSNMGSGQSVTLVLTQDGTGSRLLSSDFKFAGASKTLTTDPSAIDTITVTYDGTNYLAALVKGYA